MVVVDYDGLLDADDLPEEFSVAGVDAPKGGAEDAGHRHCVQCVVSAGVVDRRALKAAGIFSRPLPSTVAGQLPRSIWNPRSPFQPTERLP